MAFGRRNGPKVRPPANAFSGIDGRSAPAARPRGGYLGALVYACLAFGVSAVVATGWAFAHDRASTISPVSVVLYALVGAGPVVATTYAMSLAVADVLLRLLKVRRLATYVTLVAALSCAILVVPVLLLHPGGRLFYYLLFVLPGAVVGGAVLGLRRGSKPAWFEGGEQAVSDKA